MTREELLAAYNSSRRDFRSANLSRANLSRADLSRATMSEADLSRSDLSWVNLSWADLSRANLREANLREANLREANLRWADLSGADLSGADLSGADLSGAHLREANLRWADLSWAHLNGCTGIARASVGWSGHGERGRTLLAVANQDGPGLDVYHCGCFRGSLSELRDYIEAGEERYRRSRRMAAELVSMLLDDAKAVAR